MTDGRGHIMVGQGLGGGDGGTPSFLVACKGLLATG